MGFNGGGEGNVKLQEEEGRCMGSIGGMEGGLTGSIHIIFAYEC